MKKRMIIVLFCVLAGSLLFTACRKSEKTKEESTSGTGIASIPAPSSAAEAAKDDTRDSD